MVVPLTVPQMSEPCSEVAIGTWFKLRGDVVQRDEAVVRIYTPNASIDLVSPVTGIMSQVVKPTGETAAIGEVIGYMEHLD